MVIKVYYTCGCRVKKEEYLYLWPYLFLATSSCLHASTNEISSDKILSFNTKSMLKAQEALRTKKNIQLEYGHVIL